MYVFMCVQSLCMYACMHTYISIYIAPLQGNYSEALPAQARPNRRHAYMHRPIIIYIYFYKLRLCRLYYIYKRVCVHVCIYVSVMCMLYLCMHTCKGLLKVCRLSYICMYVCS